MTGQYIFIFPRFWKGSFVTRWLPTRMPAEASAAPVSKEYPVSSVSSGTCLLSSLNSSPPIEAWKGTSISAKDSM